MKINVYEAATFGLAVFTAIIVPAMILAIRSAIKWARLESKVEEVIKDVRELVDNKDKTHKEIIESMERSYSSLINQISFDRDATNKRLRYLEENYWGKNALRDSS